MPDNNKRKALYDQLTQDGYDLGNYDSFSKNLDNETNRRNLYDAITADSYDVGDYDSFSSKLDENKEGSVSNQVVAEYDKSVADAQGKKLEPDTVSSSFGGYEAGESGAALYANRQYEKAQEQTVAEEKSERERQAADMRKHLEESGQLERLNEVGQRAQGVIDKNGGEFSLKQGLFGGILSLPSAVKYAYNRLFNPEARAAYATKEKVEEAKALMDEAGHADKGWADKQLGGLARGFAKGLTDEDTWDFGVTGTADAYTLKDILSRQQKGEKITPAEQDLLDVSGLSAAVEDAYRDQVGMGYNVGRSLPESAGFMAQMYLNPASGLAKAAVKKYGTTTIKKIAARAVGDVAEMGIGTLTTGLGRVAEDAINRTNGQSTYDVDENGIIRYGGQADQENAVNATFKALGSNFIENYSEAMGEYFSPMGNFLGNMTKKGLRKGGLGKLVDTFDWMKSSQWSRAIQDFKDKTKFNGLVGEYMEEVAGNIMNAATVGDMNFNSPDDPRSVFNLETNIETALSCAFMSGTIMAVERFGDFGHSHHLSKKVVDAEREAEKTFAGGVANPAMEWSKLREGMEKATPDGLREMMTIIEEDADLTPEQKNAAINYGLKLLVWQSYNSRKMANKEEMTGEALAAEEAYNEGTAMPPEEHYSAEQEKTMAGDALRNADAGLFDTVEGLLADTKSQGEIDNLVNGLPEEQKALVLDYIEKSKRVDGILDAGLAEVEDAIAEAEDALKGAVVEDEDGNRMITSAVYKDKAVYVVADDGKHATVVYEDGKKEIVASDKLEEVQSSDADAVMEKMRESLMQGKQEALNKSLNHHPKTQEPQMGMQLWNGDVPFIVTNVSADGVVQALPAEYDAKTGQMVPKKDGLVNMSIEEAKLLQDDYYKRMAAAEKPEEVASAENVDKTSGNGAENASSLVTGESKVSENRTLLGEKGANETSATGVAPANVTTAKAQQGNGQSGSASNQSNALSGNKDNASPSEYKTGERILSSDMIGRSLSEDEAGKILMQMESHAEAAPELELTPENWDSQFGEKGRVKTPLGEVKMGENQYLKLLRKNHQGYFGMIKLTLERPDVVLEEYDPVDGAERDTKLLFIKTFIKPDGSRLVHFESVTVKRDNLEVSISSHELEEKSLTKKMQHNKVLHLNERFFSSDGRLTEPQSEGSDLVPAPNRKSYDSLHPTAQEEKPVSPDETNGLTIDGNQPALLGINSSAVSENKGSESESEIKADGANISIPTDEKGNLLYHKAPVEVTVADLTDGTLDDAEIDGFVSANQAEADKLLDKVKKGAPKIGTNKAKYIEAKKAWQAKVDDAQQQSDYWKEVYAFIKLQREQPGDKVAEEIMAMGEPLDGLELAAQRLASGNLPLLYADYKRELGFSDKEAGRMFGLFKNRENGGLTIEEAGELLMQDDLEAGTNFFDPSDANAGRNAILDVLSSVRTRGGLLDYISNNREAMAERERSAEQAYYEEKLAKEAEYFHMTPEEYETYLDVIYNENPFKGVDIAEIDAIFAEAAERYQEYLNSIEYEQGRTIETPERGDGLLSEERSGDTGRTGKSQEERDAEQARGEDAGNDAARQENEGEEIEGNALEGGEKSLSSQKETLKEQEDERREVERLSGESTVVDGENAATAILRKTGDRTTTQDGRSGRTKESLLRELAEKTSGSNEWIDNIESLISSPLGRGGENETYISRDGKSVIKVNDFSYLPDNSTNFDSFINRLDAHNELFPNDAITVIGFTLNSDGKVSVVLFQPYIGNAREATQEEIDNFLESMDFYTDMSGNWTDGTFDIADTKPNNVLVDGEGVLHFIDVLPYDSRRPGKMLEIPTFGKASNVPEVQEPTDIFEVANEVVEANKIEEARKEVDPNPTDAQKEAGNYKKGHVKIDGYDITIENPKDSERSGTDANGNKWSVTMNNDYGYIRGTEGVDGDHIDVFLSDFPTQGHVYVVDQLDVNTGKFDEHKVMYGFGSIQEATDAYLSNYSPGWMGMGAVTEVSKDEFKKWIDSSHRKTKPFAEYASVKKDADEVVQKNKEVNPSGNKLVTDERYAELRERMRKKLGGQMNMGVDPEILAIGTEMAVYHIEKDARKFVDFAKAMIGDLGDAIRPYLKAFYNGARELPEMEEAGLTVEMTPYDEVRVFDTTNFDKPVADVVSMAESVTKEKEVETQAVEAKKKLKEKRTANKKAKKENVSLSLNDLFNQNLEGNDGRRSEQEIGRGTSEDGRREPQPGTAGNQTENETLGGETREENIESERGGTSGSLHGGDVLDKEGSRGIHELSGQQRTSVKRNRNNFSFGENHIDVPQGDIAKLKGNIEAVRTLKEIEASGQPATEEQKAKLSRYVGWGGLANALDSEKYEARKRPYSYGYDANWNSKYLPYYEQLKELLTDEEFNSAVQSTTTSHYTPEPVIRALWNIAERMGFKGGSISEPAMGVGHIIGMVPKSISEQSSISGYEMDSLSGRIASVLYPDARVKVQGYETEFAPQSKDLVITNVPFGKNAPYDKALDKSLRKKMKGAYNLHNYFIAKGLLELRDGGIGIFVTSSATMDGADSSFREFAQSNGFDLVGAIRLPNDAFQKNAGTSVTADVLVFKKRKNGEQANRTDYTGITQIGEGSYEENGEKRTKPIMVNEYFANHPEMMLGEMMTAHDAGSGGLYSGASQTLKAKKDADLEKALSEAVELLPKDILSLNASSGIGEEKEKTELKDGSIVAKGNKVYVAMNGELEEVSSKETFTFNGKTRKTVDAVNEYNGIKDTLKELITAEQGSTVDPEPIRKRLNKQYDDFVAKYGTLNHNKSLDDVFSEDFEHNLPLSLEKVERVPSPSGKSMVWKVSKGKGILDKRVSFPVEEPSKAENLQDAVNISISYRGVIDILYVASLTGKDATEIEEEMLDNGIAFRDPLTGSVVDRETYLSGNVKDKLDEARAIAEVSPEYQRNVDELAKVQPETIRFGDISYRLGTPWIPTDFVSKFAEDILGITDAGVQFIPELNEFVLSKKARVTDFAKSGLYKTGRLGVIDVFNNALNQRKPKVYDEVSGYGPTGKTTSRVVNEAETQAASEKIMEVSDKFVEWVDSHKELHRELERIYNDKYNNYRLKEYSLPSFSHPEIDKDGKEVIVTHYPSSNTDISLREHQAKAVQRSLHESTLLAHQVGTGKTFTMITTAMEMRRLGIAKKPMIVVQNATLEDFVKDFYKLYPGANVLAPGKDERSAENRKRLFNLIATGDFDAIVIPQSFMQFIPDDEGRKKELIQKKIDEYEKALARIEDYGLQKRIQRELDAMRDNLEGVEKKGKKRSVKDKAKAAENIKSRMERKLDRKTDDVLSFEKMGIDALFIDEAHNFKKIGFVSKMSNVKGIDTGASQRANSLLLKAKWVQEKNGGRNVVLATGTPITNTMAEVWTMMNFVAPEILDMYNINSFDDFATTFGQVEPSLEFTATGNFKIADRFKSYVNVPELVKAFRSHTDVVLTSDVKEFKESNNIPKLKDDKMTNVIIDKNEDLEDVMQMLIRQMERYNEASGQMKKEMGPVPLVVFGKAKQAAIDLRLLNPAYPDNPNSKTNQVVGNIVKLYKESTPDKGTQLVFCDSYQSPGERPQMDLFDYDPDVPRFNLYDDIKDKLISQGIPANEIAIVNNYDGERRKNLFEKVRNGDVRVLLGSTEKMGVGVNVQDRLYALHHIDAPIRPMDFEQRNGRILRQGNLYATWGKPVNVVTYGVQGTLDATAYDRLRVKQDFINQMMKGDVSGRVMDEQDDEDPSGMTFSEMAATLSGDKTAQLLFAAQNKLKRLINSKRSDANSKSGMADTIESARNRIKLLESKKKVYEQASSIVEKYFQNGVESVDVNGQQITEKFGVSLDPVILRYDEDYSLNRGIAPLKLSLNGGQAEVIVHFNEGRMVYELYAGKEHLVEGRQFNGGKGLMSSIEHQLKASNDNLKEIENNISENEKKIAGLEKAMSAPWGKEDELKAAEKEVENLTKQLNEKAEANTKGKKALPEDGSTRFRVNEPAGEAALKWVEPYDAVENIVEEEGARLTLNNVNQEIYKMSGPYLRRLYKYGSLGRVLVGEYADIDQMKARREYELAAKHLLPLRKRLEGMLPYCTEAARREVEQCIGDIDYALDYYKGLSEGKDVWRTAVSPRYRFDENAHDSSLYNEGKEKIVSAVDELSGKLHTHIKIARTLDDVSDAAARRAIGQGRAVKAWFDPNIGEVVVYLPNATDVNDAVRSVLHEVVGHKGLRELLGKDSFDDAMMELYRQLPVEARNEIADVAVRKYNGNVAIAMDEYLAEQAEKDETPTWWGKVVSAIRNLLRKAGVDVELSEGDVKYLLWRSRKKLEDGDALDLAEDVMMRYKNGVGEYGNVSGKEIADAVDRYKRTVANAPEVSIITDVEDIDSLPISGITKGELKDKLKSKQSSGCYSHRDRMIFVFPGIVKNAKDLEDTVNHETAHYASRSLGLSEQQKRDLFEYVRDKRPDIREKVMRYSAHQRNEEAVAYLFEEICAKNGLANVLKIKFAGDINVAEIFTEITKFLNYGRRTDNESGRGDSETGRKVGRPGVQEENGRTNQSGDRVAGVRGTDGQDRILAGRRTMENLQRLEGKEKENQRMGRALGAGYELDVRNSETSRIEEEEKGARETRSRRKESEGISNGGIRFREADDAPVREKAMAREHYERVLNTAGYKMQESWQDSMLGLKEAQEAIAKATHSRIMDYENAYMAENALSSTNLPEMEAYSKLVFKPLLDEVNALVAKGAVYGDVSDYLMAKHGIERNREMAVRKALREDEETMAENLEGWNETKHAVWDDGSLSWREKQEKLDAIAEKEFGADLSNDYSGLSAVFDEAEDWKKEAYGFVEGFEEKFKPSSLMEKVNEATDAILTKQRESGLISADTMGSIQGMYQYYVPLRGFKVTTADEVYDYLTTETSSFSAPVRTTRGRRSAADDPIATIANVAESGIVQGNKNLMKQKFLTMVQNHRTDLVSVNDLWVKENEVTGEWEAVFPDIPSNATPRQVEQIVEDFNKRMEELSKEEKPTVKHSRDAVNIPYKILPKNLKEHQVIVKRGGKSYVLTINGNPRAAQALNGMTNPDASDNPFLKALNAANRFMAQNFTARNPAFVVSNLFRDGIYANSTIWVKESPLYAKKYNKNWMKSVSEMAGLVKRYKANKLDLNNPTDKMFAEFIANGGETGYTFIKSVEDYKGIIAKELKKSQRGKLSPAKAIDVLGNAMDTFGRWAEDTSRFAAYRTSREMGRSIARSVLDAKEISVNFNKKGAGSKTAGKYEKGNRLNAIQAGAAQGARGLYIFWNAGVQGLANFGKLAKNHKGKFAGLVSAYYVLGSMMPVLNMVLAQALGGDDDDYYDLPEHVRRTNICLYAGGEWITVPLPIELRAVYGLGELACGALSGKDDYTPEELVVRMAEQVSQILPIDMLEGEGGFSAFVPSSVKPLYEAFVTNKDWTGIPIYKENDFNANMPEWTKAYSRTSPELVKMAETLNAWRGGTKYRPGRIDVNPAIVEHLFESYLGGVGTTLNQAKKMVMMPFDEEMQELRNVPILSRFVRSADERAERKRIDELYYRNVERFGKIGQEYNGYRKELNNPKNSDVEFAEYTDLLNKLENSEEFQKYLLFKEDEKELKRMRDAFKESGDEEIEGMMYAKKAEMNEALK